VAVIGSALAARAERGEPLCNELVRRNLRQVQGDVDERMLRRNGKADEDELEVLVMSRVSAVVMISLEEIADTVVAPGLDVVRACRHEDVRDRGGGVPGARCRVAHPAGGGGNHEERRGQRDGERGAGADRSPCRLRRVMPADLGSDAVEELRRGLGALVPQPLLERLESMSLGPEPVHIDPSPCGVAASTPPTARSTRFLTAG